MIDIKNAKKDIEETGFGKNPTTNNQRLLNKDGSANVRRKGLPFFKPHEAYSSLIYMSWGRFWTIILFFYFTINVIFASVYLLLGIENLTGANGLTTLDQFFDAFFFSAQTISTVGYGHLSPAGFATSVVAAFESMIGLLAFAMATGLLYGRFSRPSAKIIYSKNIIKAPYQNGEAYMFRLANFRTNQLIELNISLMLSINKVENNLSIRKFIPLTLELSNINLLILSWTLVHPLNEDSPLFGLSIQELIDGEAEFLIMLKAFDDSFSQNVHSRTSYKPNDIVFDAKFDKIIAPDQDGVFTIDLSKVSDFTLV
jgi:inward rectifier potassium channel